MAREDLAARFARITRRLAAAERPVLDRHRLSMWQYIVLSHLAGKPAWPDPVCWSTACESRWVVAVGKVVGLADGLPS